jgi:ubiquitin
VEEKMSKKTLNILFIVVLLSIFSGCKSSSDDSSGSSSDDSSGGGDNTKPSVESCMSTQAYSSIPTDGTVKGSTDDSIDSFVDLTQAEFKITDTTIEVKISVREMPTELTYNKYKQGYAEYGWSIYFDMDNNSKLSTDDLELSLGYYKKNKDDQEKKENLLSFAQAVFSHMTEVTGTAGNCTASSKYFIQDFKKTDSTEEATVKVSSNTIIFFVPKAKHAYLDKITNSVKVRVTASHNNSEKSFFDSLPE